RMFSLRPLGELATLLKEHERDRSKRVAQRELARSMTSWVHGEAEITRVETANRVFKTGSLDGLSAGELTAPADTVPAVDVARSELAAGISIVDLLARTVRDSKSDARRLVQQGGAYVNNARIGGVEHKVTTSDLVAESWLLVRGGKTDYRL